MGKVINYDKIEDWYFPSTHRTTSSFMHVLVSHKRPIV
jgi:hypothetical protein